MNDYEEDAVLFIKAWQEAHTLQEAADSLGIAPIFASSKAAKMRKKGVPLKRFKGGGKIDWKAMAEFAEELS